MTKSRRNPIILTAFAASIALPIAANAQGGADIFIGMVGGMIAAAQTQAAQEAWSHLPETRAYCFQKAVQRAGTNVGALIRAGIAPSDPRISNAVSVCGRFSENLKRHYRCSISDERGNSIQTFCNQAFGRQQFGRVETLDVRSAIDAFFSNGQLMFVDVEEEGSRQDRILKAEAEAKNAELRQIVAGIANLKQSRSDLVRTQFNSMIQKVNAGSAVYTPDAARSDAKRLAELENIETARIFAFDKLNASRAALMKREPSFPPDIRSEFEKLNIEYESMLRSQQRPVSNPSSALPSFAGKLGPSFDCQQAKRPLEKVICSDSNLSRLDLSVLQPFYILRHLKPEDRPTLRQEAIDLTSRSQLQCKIKDKGSISGRALKQAVSCVTAIYEKQQSEWRDRVAMNGLRDSQEESRRPIDQHITLQQYLRDTGYLNADEKIDGIYGAATRTAVAALQSSEGKEATGIVSDAIAEALRERLRRGVSIATPVSDKASQPQLADLQQRYVSLAVSLDRYEVKVKRQKEELETLKQAVAYLEDTLTLELPLRTKSEAEKFLQLAATATRSGDAELVAPLAAEFDTLKSKIDPLASLAKASTPKNRFIVTGSLGDWIVLYNDTGKAPSVVKNLRGDLVFESAKTNICKADKSEMSPAVSRRMNERFGPWGQVIGGHLPICNTGDLLMSDLVIFERGGLLKEPPATAVALLSAIDTGAFAEMLTVTADEVSAATQAETVKIIEIETYIEKGQKSGFAIAILMNSNSKMVCGAITANSEPHEAILAKYKSRLSEEMKGTPGFVTTNADAAFIAAKRGQCGAIYANSEVLKELLSALKRDQIDVRFLPIWIEPEDVEKANRVIVEARINETQQEADLRRRKADDQQLANLKANEASVVRAQKQTELQQQFGAAARSFENALRLEMKKLFEERAKREVQKYPFIDNWFSNQINDRWELQSINTQLLDFGVSVFKDRRLETGFGKTTVKLRNRVLGEYRDACFVTGFMMDKEFEMERESFVSACDGSDSAMAKYKAGQRFTSNWLAP